MAPKGAEYQEIAHQRAIEKKTHVTFPQLKYPSLRDSALKDPVQWLTGKAMDDGAEGLWRVHNGLYDLTEFLHKHPGGSEWLDLTKGTDITEAFESHHLNSSVNKTLEKFYVRDAKTPRNSPFVFEDDGFYRTLRRAIFEELKKVPKDTHKKSDRIIDGDFRVSHALSHHLYPNTLMDLEISAFEPLVYWNPRKDKPFYSKHFALLIECLYFPFTFLVLFFTRFISALVRKGYYTNHFHFTDLVGALVPVWMWLASGCTFYEAFTMWLWIICTGSLIFYTTGSNAAHHHPDIWKDGDQPSYKTETPDWGMHELEAVMDRKDINGSHFRILTFFGNHALHHLFPTLDHAVLTYLYPVFLEHVKKYRANFRLTSQFDLFIGQYKSALKTDFKVYDD
ncbi:hypothetical protein MSG28_002787 [Choristoneura fumiferana]|uniref:Uncharacterized protein n=1 Tax=Choristoneura fumiferana TaxID=7141 RepID=A0ACC0JJB9_CHOFU|nr:hypothetical protein MSG28_002787 [Choristoneura fumiferana]